MSGIVTVTKLDRARGALIGVHAGDSLGATLEFKSAADCTRQHPNGLRDIIGGGTFGWAAGAPTDDTDLTWAICQGYLDSNFDPDQTVRAAANRMVAWYKQGPVDIGGTTAKALAAVARGTDPTRSGVADDQAMANGSLMRTAGVAVARLNDPDLMDDEARSLSAVTHANPVCEDSCVLYCRMIASLVHGTSPWEAVAAVAAALDGTVDQRVLAAVREAVTVAERRQGLDGLTGPRGGYVLWALKVAVHQLLAARTFEDGVVDVVMLGDDADTNGAITGGLLGARFGFTGIPVRWVDALHLRDSLDEFVDQATGR